MAGKRWIRFAAVFASIATLAAHNLFIPAETADAASSGYVQTRLFGDTRFDTAVAIAKAGWARADGVFIADGLDFPDAMAGCPAAASFGWPILLSNASGLSKNTLAEISKLGAKTAYLLGGTGAVPGAVTAQLKSAGVTKVSRYGGANRSDTAAKIGEILANAKGYSKTVLLVNGNGYADALAAGPIAGILKAPILFTDVSSIPDETMNFLKTYKVTHAVIVGGSGAVGSAVVTKLRGMKISVDQYGGTSRFDTMAKLNTAYKSYFGLTAVVATGMNYPDALAGGVLAATKRAPMILVDPDTADPPSTCALTAAFGTNSVYVLGGTGAAPNVRVRELFGGASPSNSILATGISLNKKTGALTTGQTDTLTATVTPSNATDDTVIWKTDNAAVAAVSGGKVTTKGPGTVTITATAADGSNKSADCTYTVKQLATGVTLNKSASALDIGQSETLTATVSPANASNKAVTWKSSNQKVATVDAKGIVKAVAPGVATITVTTADGSKKSATCAYTVNTPDVTLNKTAVTLDIGKAETLVATTHNSLSKTVTWKTSNPNIAAVDAAGKVTAKALGVATITATMADGSKKSAGCVVTVVQPSSAVMITRPLAVLKIWNGGKSKDTETLKAAVMSKDTINKAVTWSSSNSGIASVGAATGVVTPNAPGTVVITATTADGSKKSASCTIDIHRLADSVSLNKTKNTLTKSKKFPNPTDILIATVKPDNTTNKAVTWKSSNKAVVSVSTTGVVTAVGPGTAVITATTADGTGWSASCNYTVVQLATGVALNKTTSTLNVGGSETLIATVSPANTSDKAVTWSSSNTAIATVDATGKVTARAPGTATITVMTADGSNKTATCDYTVYQLATGVALNKTTSTLNVGGSETLIATVSPANTSNKSVTWSSSDITIATVSSTGMVMAKAPGTATITVMTADGSNKTATCDYTVYQLATGVALNKTTSTLTKSAAIPNPTETLIATVAPPNTTNPAVTWSTSNSAVATVSASGVVRAIGPGTATITVTTADGSNQSASCNYTVIQLATSISLNKMTSTLTKSAAIPNPTETLIATVAPPNTTNPAVTWSTSNSAVATVSASGVVRAIGPGTATITVTTADGSNQSATCVYTVTQLATNITLNRSTFTLPAGQTDTLIATVTPSNTSNPDVTWSSSNTSVATVSSTGVVTAVAPGSAIITATTKDGTNLSASCTYTVSTNSKPLSGTDCYTTAVNISQQMYSSADTVILVTTGGYADTLSATGLADALNAPILYTDLNSVPAVTMSEINRLGATKIILIGGTGVISQAEENNLGLSYAVRRYDGSATGTQRADTNMDVNQAYLGTVGSKGQAILVNGDYYPDCQVMSGLAAQLGIPMLYSDFGALNPATITFLQHNNITQVTVVDDASDPDEGQVSALITALQGAGITVTTISASDAYTLSAKVATQYSSTFSGSAVVLASGTDFTDSPTAGVLAAKESAPILLCDPSTGLNAAEIAYANSILLQHLYVVGNSTLIPQSVINQIVQ